MGCSSSFSVLKLCETESFEEEEKLKLCQNIHMGIEMAIFHLFQTLGYTKLGQENSLTDKKETNMFKLLKGTVA